MNSLKIIVLILLLGLITYSSSLINPFIWDDLVLIVENNQIKHFSNIHKIFTSSLAPDPNTNKTLALFYRPIQSLTYMFDYSIFKLNPWGYHLSNILLHIVCALLIYSFASLLTKDNIISIISAILFVVHPIHTEAITYISGRADILAAIFFLLTLITYIKATSSMRQLRFSYIFISLFVFVLSLLSKEIVLILPFVILLYNFCFVTKDKISKFNKTAILYFIVASMYIVLTWMLIGFQNTHLLSYKSPFIVRTITAIKAFFIYLSLLLYPQNLHMERISPIITSIWDISGILSLFSFFLLLIFIIRMYKHSKLFFFASFWFLINLFPVSGILLRLNAVMAEHWLYIPSIGYFLTIALFFKKLEKNKILNRTMIFIIVSIIVLFYSFITIKQNKAWANPVQFYERIISYSPESSKAYSNLGIIYQEKGDYQKALYYYDKALEITTNELILNQIGLIYIETNRLQKAEELFNNMLSNYPLYANAYNNLGNICIKKREYQKAIDFFRKAIDINPRDSKFHDNLGLAYLEIGNFNDALNEFKCAISLNPTNAESHNNLGNLYARKGWDNEAIEQYKKAIELKPDFDKPHFNLGVIYFQKGLIEKAKEEWKKTLGINPNHPSALKNLELLQDKK